MLVCFKHSMFFQYRSLQNHLFPGVGRFSKNKMVSGQKRSFSLEEAGGLLKGCYWNASLSIGKHLCVKSCLILEETKTILLSNYHSS